MATEKPKLGILAGSGSLPARLAEAARADGRDVFVVALSGEADPAAFAGFEVASADIAAVGRTIDMLKAKGCGDLVMAGPVRRPDFTRLRPDWRGVKLLPKVAAAARQGDNALFNVLVAAFEDEGFRVVGADDVLGGLVAGEGPIGRLVPDGAQHADIARALEVAKALGALDVGQGAVVVEGVVLGVELTDGTDAMLARVAEMRRSHGPAGAAGVLVKAAKPGQERRVDLPTIGPRTVAGAAAARLAGIAVEAGHALVMDRAATAEAADAAGLYVVGVEARDGR
jgi:DUF1009 family protein